jgi:hypothetical protein
VKTKAHLEAHTELYEQALARAWEMGVMEQSARINATLLDDDRRKPSHPDCETDNAKVPTEIT